MKVLVSLSMQELSAAKKTTKQLRQEYKLRQVYERLRNKWRRLVDAKDKSSGVAARAALKAKVKAARAKMAEFREKYKGKIPSTDSLTLGRRLSALTSPAKPEKVASRPGHTSRFADTKE